MSVIINICNQILKRGRSLVILNKILRRGLIKKFDKTKYRKWLDSNKIPLDKFLESLNKSLFLESNYVHNEIIANSKLKLEKIGVKLGGGASDKLLYFIVRFIKPNIVLETGVAAGFSSISILKALKKNNSGKLYSSDFPYFRIKNPEKYIGILVDRKKFPDWNLQIEGDMINIPKFVKNFEKIDLFHYDSDKTYIGKSKVYNIIKKKISKKSILIFDDIQDDLFFYEIQLKSNLDSWVFKFKNKYIGMLGKFNNYEN